MLRQRLGRWTYPALAVATALLDVLADGFSVSVLRLWAFVYKSSWLIWGVPVTTAAFCGVLEVCMLSATVSLSRLLRVEPDVRRGFTIAFLLPCGAADVAVAVMTLVLSTTKPW
jgi:hypothetical protein